MAEYKVVDAEKLDADLTEIADEVRTLANTSVKMTIDEVASNIAQANADVETQADIIAQIRTALEGKAAGGGGDSYEVINSIINSTITEFYTAERFDSTDKNLGNFFNSCSKMTKWAMPNNVNNLGQYCFRYCPMLTYIDIGKPPSCSAQLFYGRPLKGASVVIRSETPPTLSGTFSGTSFDNTTVFYVPKNSIEAYKSATNWSTYADCYKAIEDYPEITGGII